MEITAEDIDATIVAERELEKLRQERSRPLYAELPEFPEERAPPEPKRSTVIRIDF